MLCKAKGGHLVAWEVSSEVAHASTAAGAQQAPSLFSKHWRLDALGGN
jgi:hypothetical protein